MNRAERRRLQREQKISSVEVKDIAREQKAKQVFAELQAREEAIKKEAYGFAINDLYTVLGTILEDKYGWGKVRINRLFNQLEDRFACILDDKTGLTMEDLEKQLLDRLGGKNE